MPGPKIRRLPDAAVTSLLTPWNGRRQGAPDQEEDTVHPYIAQALTAERVGDWQKRAELARLTKQARRARHGITAVSHERLANRGQALTALPQSVSSELEGADCAR